jgi:hypothetical protein
MYHVILDGQGLILNLAAYEKRPAQALRLAETERVAARPEYSGGTLETSYASAQAGFSVMRAYQGKLYAGSASSGKVFEFDGTTWSESHDHGGGVAGISAMAEWDGTLYVANASNGSVAARRGDGAAWRFPEFTFTGAAGIGALAGLPGAGGTARGLLYAVGNRVLSVTSAATARAWDLSALSADLFRLNERDASAATTFGGKLRLFGAEKAGQPYGALYSGPGWTLDRQLPDGYVLGVAGLGDELYLAASNGVVHRLAGQRLDPVGTVPGLKDILVYAGALWCSARDATNGVHVRRFDGLGWSIPFAAGSGSAAGALGVYGNRLYLGRDGDILRTSIAFAPTGAARREWRMEAFLEGTAQVPLLRLDGTPEPKTGAQLSTELWTRLVNGKPVSFVDLNGTAHTLWIVARRQPVDNLSQRNGYQTVAKLTLVEA